MQAEQRTRAISLTGAPRRPITAQRTRSSSSDGAMGEERVGGGGGRRQRHWRRRWRWKTTAAVSGRLGASERAESTGTVCCRASDPSSAIHASAIYTPHSTVLGSPISSDPACTRCPLVRRPDTAAPAAAPLRRSSSGPSPATSTHQDMDWQGQKRAEMLMQVLLVASAVAAFLAGYVRADFQFMLLVYAAGVVLTALVTVPNWPFFNRNPLKWLDAAEAERHPRPQVSAGAAAAGGKKKSGKNKAKLRRVGPARSRHRPEQFE
ncbi:hypothetical protein U9M48_033707, partial [Paspalum notatum var. saurae]